MANPETVSISVASSSANVGPFYDAGSIGLKNPVLRTFLTRRPESRDITVDIRSREEAPTGRLLGHAGQVALKGFYEDHKITDGAVLEYSDSGYPVGGLGRSGAEAVGAVMAAAVLYEVKLSRDEIIKAAAVAEPGGHLDNVAASTNGRLNLMARSPHTGELSVAYYDVPENLGVRIGISSHQKTGGTEEGRNALLGDVTAVDFKEEVGLASSSIAALLTGDTDRFLEHVTGDRFHEPRRANVHFYGDFNAEKFSALKKSTWQKFKVALNVSGAGPNMLFMFNKDTYRDGIGEATDFVKSWFGQHGIDLGIRGTEIAAGGAYDEAARLYNYSPR